MVKIEKVPPAVTMYYIEKDGQTAGHIEQVGKTAGSRFQFLPTTIFNTKFTALELQDIVDFLEKINGNS